ncbi:hypothetical protein D3C78_301900 [compost metagenome]
MKGIRYCMGFISGWWSGWLEGRRLARLWKDYGGLENIPTRELMQTGPMGPVMARRQQVKIGMIYLISTLKVLKQPEIPNTIELVSRWLDFKDLAAEDLISIENISRSNSVIHSLVDLAVRKDDLCMTLLMEAFRNANKVWVWEQYRTNNSLTVDK